MEKEKSRVPERMQNQDLVAIKIEKGCRIYKKVTIVMVSYEHRSISIESRKVTTCSTYVCSLHMCIMYLQLQLRTPTPAALV